jgi:subtilase family serine protease
MRPLLRRIEACQHSCWKGMLIVCLAIPGWAGQSRIHGRILDDRDTFVLRNQIPALLSHATDLGPVDISVHKRLALQFAPTAAQQTDLDRLTRAQTDPSNPQYHRWLSPEEYADRFGLSQADTNKVVSWLESVGFQNVVAARSRSFVTGDATVIQVQHAFGVQMHRYSYAGTLHISNSTDPVMPRSLRPVISGIRGLNDFRPRPHRVQRHFTRASTGSHYLTPSDVATIYNTAPLYGSGIDGSGVTIAIVGQSDIDLTDIARFRTAAGLTANNPTITLVGTDPGYNAVDRTEAELDLEWAGAVAPGASLIYVNSDDAFSSLQYAIDQALARVIVVSYGGCEQDIGADLISRLNAELQKAAAQGISVISASGDFGAADCDAGNPVAERGATVDFPAASPYVTSVGGTSFADNTSGSYWGGTNQWGGSALSAMPEVAWNDSTGASGGGPSSMFAKPIWQKGLGVPADGRRDVPDVAMAASQMHDGYLACLELTDCAAGFEASDLSLDTIGGTSVSGPVFAGIVALLNQKFGPQGLLGPRLYSLASVSSNALRDIVSGDNRVPCRVGSPDCVDGTVGYFATPGYDHATGLGSVDASNLLEQWTSDFTLSGPGSITLSRGASTVTNIAVTAVGGFGAPVTFTCSVGSGLGNTQCSISGIVTGSGTAALTVTNADHAVLVSPIRYYFFCLLLTIGGFALLIPKRLGSKVRPRLLPASAVLILALTAGCGGGSSSPSTKTVSPVSPPSTGNITVVATSGVVSHTMAFQVTVQ